MENQLSQFGTVVAAVITLLSAADSSMQAATFNWTNTVSGGWSTAANWNPNGVPGASDTALITNAGVTVTLNAATTVGAVILGTNGGGPVTLSLAGQTLSLNGPLTVNPSGSFTVDGGALIGNTNAVLGGTIGWMAGFVEGILTLASGSTLSITTGNNHDMPNCIFTNNGTVVWNNGPIRSGAGGTTIYNYGLWDAQSDQPLTTSGYNGLSTFHNFGTFRKSGGASEFANATTFVSPVVFNQLAGVLDVQNGTNGLQVAFQAGGSFTGGYLTTNQFGLTVLSSGNFNLNGTMTGTNTWQNGGNLVGTTVINGALTWVSGNWNGAPSVTIPASSALLITTANNHDLPNCLVTNYGTVVWNGGDIRSGASGTTIYNYGLWNARSDQQLTTSGYNGSTVFNNFGTFRKSEGTNTSQTLFTGSVLFNQPSGVLDVQQGNFTLAGSGNFTGGYITTNTTGTTYFAAGNFNLNGTATGTNVIENAGNLVGTNVIKGALNWVGGNWINAPSVTIPVGSTLLISSANNHDLPNCILTNYGTVVWHSGDLRSGGSGTTICNYGLWNAQSDQQLTTSGYNGLSVFHNFGTFRKSAGTGNTLFTGGVLFNQPSGVLDVQTGNVVFQGSGNFTGGYITTNTTGTTYFSAGSFNLNGTATGTNVIENAGNLVGTNVIKGALHWVAGDWINAPSVTIPVGSTLLISSANNHDLPNCIVTNHGTVVWHSGDLRSGASGTTIYNYGLWNAQSDQQLTTSGYNGSTVFNNFGTFRKSGGINPAINTVFAGGVLFNQPGGILDVQTGNVVLQGSANFTGGSITTNGTGTTYFAAGSFNLNGTSTGTNVIENAGNLVGANVINGALNWVAGSWNGISLTLLTNSIVTVSGGGNHDMANTTVTNYGTVVWASGDIRSGGSGTLLYNYGLWDAQSDQQLNTSSYNGPTVFNNFATFRKSAGSPTSQTLFAGGVLLNQLAGAVDVREGNLTLQGNGNFTGGTANNPSGSIYLSIGSYNINGTATANMIENSASLTGVNVINGTLDWVAGSWNGITLTILTNSLVTISGGAGNNDLPNSTVTNYGTVVWASGDMRGGAGGTVMNNYGLWEAQSDHALTTSGYNGSIAFNNFGTFRKAFTSGSTVFAGGVTFNNTGKMDAQHGNIALQGPYTLANGTKMGFGLEGWLGNGSISLPGPAAFTGSLSVNLNGVFWPGPGSSFNLLNYASESGVLFTNTVLPPGFTWETNYKPHVLCPVRGQPPSRDKHRRDQSVHGESRPDPSLSRLAGRSHRLAAAVADERDQRGLADELVHRPRFVTDQRNLPAR